ncbi:MAG: nucleotidyl transferase AbiEii/AbiGii toxin family protein [Actinomycetia bacterium]|nr:nucleotidyl transferase AbiEii/AbiGii toxin family protein [Actinomycetes bacterium]
MLDPAELQRVAAAFGVSEPQVQRDHLISHLLAWHDRSATRDLWDLWALARHGHLTSDAADLYARLGPTNHRPDPDMFATAPRQDRWERTSAVRYGSR